MLWVRVWPRLIAKHRHSSQPFPQPHTILNSQLSPYLSIIDYMTPKYGFQVINSKYHTFPRCHSQIPPWPLFATSSTPLRKSRRDVRPNPPTTLPESSGLCIPNQSIDKSHAIDSKINRNHERQHRQHLSPLHLVLSSLMSILDHNRTKHPRVPKQYPSLSASGSNDISLPLSTSIQIRFHFPPMVSMPHKSLEQTRNFLSLNASRNIYPSNCLQSAPRAS